MVECHSVKVKVAGSSPAYGAERKNMEENVKKIIDDIENNIEIVDDKSIYFNPETFTPSKHMVIRWNPEMINDLNSYVGTLSASKEIVSILCRKITMHILGVGIESLSGR